ncbi:MAG: hypothetical protein HQK53_19715 [Oligoflexia bacterium]|nr:hypothetical protein [Oligoflexia bacterium]
MFIKCRMLFVFIIVILCAGITNTATAAAAAVSTSLPITPLYGVFTSINYDVFIKCYNQNGENLGGGAFGTVYKHNKNISSNEEWLKICEEYPSYVTVKRANIKSNFSVADNECDANRKLGQGICLVDSSGKKFLVMNFYDGENFDENFLLNTILNLMSKVSRGCVVNLAFGIDGSRYNGEYPVLIRKNNGRYEYRNKRSEFFTIRDENAIGKIDTILNGQRPASTAIMSQNDQVELCKILVSRGGHVPLEQVVTEKIVRGFKDELAVLIASDICHEDLHFGNIMYFSKGSDDFGIKIIDLGQSLDTSILDDKAKSNCIINELNSACIFIKSILRPNNLNCDSFVQNISHSRLIQGKQEIMDIIENLGR